MHWQLTGLRTSCAMPPAKKSRANQSFFISFAVAVAVVAVVQGV
jgi:hypothetical protein